MHVLGCTGNVSLAMMPGKKMKSDKCLVLCLYIGKGRGWCLKMAFAPKIKTNKINKNIFRWRSLLLGPGGRQILKSFWKVPSIVPLYGKLLSIIQCQKRPYIVSKETQCISLSHTFWKESSIVPVYRKCARVLTFAHGARSSWALVAGMCGRARTRTRKDARYGRAHATPPLSSVRCHR